MRLFENKDSKRQEKLLEARKFGTSTQDHLKISLPDEVEATSKKIKEDFKADFEKESKAMFDKLVAKYGKHISHHSYARVSWYVKPSETNGSIEAISSISFNDVRTTLEIEFDGWSKRGFDQSKVSTIVKDASKADFVSSMQTSNLVMKYEMSSSVDSAKLAKKVQDDIKKQLGVDMKVTGSVLIK